MKKLIAILLLIAVSLFVAGSSDMPVAQILTDLDVKYAEKLVKSLRVEAAQFSKNAEAYSQKAKSYRASALAAEEQVIQSRDIKSKQAWQQSAKTRRRLADDAQTAAVEFTKKAKAKANEADTLETRLKAQKQKIAQDKKRSDKEFKKRQNERKQAQEYEEKRYRMTVEEAIGVWRPEKKGDWPFVIVQQKPGSDTTPYLLEAHSSSRVWKGEYEPTDRGDPVRAHEARMRFTYKPAATEMNKDIPAWARQQIDGELEWVLEINEDGNAATPYLDVKWYPGEVEWQKGEKARIIGRGKPREFRLSQEVRLSIEEMSFASLWVEIVTAKKSRAEKSKQLTIGPQFMADSVESLLKHQSFTVKARIPAAQAKNLGDSIKVLVKAEGGAQTSLTLLRRTANGSRPVLFSLDKPITIADEGSEEDVNPPFGSVSWIGSKFSLEEGRRIRLEVDNKEIVTFSYDGAEYPVMIYDRWFDRGIDQHIASASVMVVENQMALASNDFRKLKKKFGTADPKIVAMAQRRLVNYAKLMAQEDLLDLHKYYLGEVYLNRGMASLGLSIQSSDPAVFAAMAKPMILLSDAEMGLILANMSPIQSYRNYMTIMVKGYIFALKGKKAPPVAVRMANRIDWTSPFEKLLVATTLQGTSEKIEDGIVDVINQLAYAIPKTATENFSIIFLGRDLKGKRKTKLDRALVFSKVFYQAAFQAILFKAVRFVNSKVTLPPMGRMQRLRFNLRRPLGRGRVASSIVRKTKTTVISEQKGVASVSSTPYSNIPDTMTPAQKGSLTLNLTDTPKGGGPINCKTVRPKGVLDGKFLQNLDLKPSRTPSEIARARRAIAEDLYGKSVGFSDNSKPIYAAQTAGTCQVHSMVRQIRKATKTNIDAAELVMQVVEFERFVMRDLAVRGKLDKVKTSELGLTVKVNRDTETLNYYKNLLTDPKTADLGSHIRYVNENGFNNLTARHFMRSKGASVSSVIPSLNSRTGVRHMVMAKENGYDVRVALDLSKNTGKPESFHIVEVTGFKRLAKDPDIITGVKFAESNLGGEVLTLPLAEFESIIARNITYSNLEIIKWGN